MPSWHCSVTLDVTADDPVEAAQRAQDMLDASYEKFVWEIEQFEGPNIGLTSTVDTEKDQVIG